MTFPDPDLAVTVDTQPRKRGLGKKDAAILDQIFIDGLIRPNRIWFDVPTGTVNPDVLAATPPSLREWAMRTYSKRVDIIFEDFGIFWIGEVKPYAAYVALGQTLLYTALASAKPDPIGRFMPAILTDVVDPDLAAHIVTFDIRLIELGRFLEPRPAFQT